MAEKKCKYCAMMIPKEASICPHCRKRQPGWTRAAKLGLVLIIVVFIGAWLGSFNSPPKKPVYTNEQKKAAEEYQTLLMASGLVREYKPEGSLQVVYVNRLVWDFNTFEKKKELLKGFSQSNEILGYTPWIEIRDYISGEVYAAIKPPLTFEVYK